MPHVPSFLQPKGAMGGLEPRRHSSESPSLRDIPSVTNNNTSEHTTQTSCSEEPLSILLSRDSKVQNRRSFFGRSQNDHSLLAVQQENRSRLFSLIKSKYASESQLSTKGLLESKHHYSLMKKLISLLARLHSDLENLSSNLQQSDGATATAYTDSVPPTPSSVLSFHSITKQRSKKKYRYHKLSRRSTHSNGEMLEKQKSQKTETPSKKVKDKFSTYSIQQNSRNHTSFERNKTTSQAGPPPYGDDATSTLALPLNRLSDSSRSDVSLGDHGVYATTTTTHTVHTTTTLFRLPRRRKQNPLFDLSHLPKKSEKPESSQSSVSLCTSGVFPQSVGLESSSTDFLHHSILDDILEQDRDGSLPSSSNLSKLPFTGSRVVRHESRASNRSSPACSRVGSRSRSSTVNSIASASTDDSTPTQVPPSSRFSSSTGRKSLGEILRLSSKSHLTSESLYPRCPSGILASGASTPKNSSMQLPREAPLVIPERHEDDTPAKYLIRLEEAVSRGVVASVLSKGSDSFSQAVLRSYMRGFGFFGDPMDMAIRKLLMEVELPKETQHIDRCLQGFANRYHECNPGIYASPDQAYFIAFSLLMLHTDVFNKNNKHKMQKSDYLKNTRGGGIFDEILECFYDNISYTPFIHVEDDLDINGERIIPHKTRKKMIFSVHGETIKRPSKEPVDPYTLIIDRNLDSLRPNLKDVLYLEEHYNYLGTASSLSLSDLHNTFFKTGILQIVSARSRPDAFMSDVTLNNPEEAQAGIVDIKITKVGLLWRKDPQKKKTRSPWQEWGAILTGAQLYFFKNTAWVKSLMNQLDTHIKQGHDGFPVIFKPPLEQFKPDALMSTDDSVALLDSLYKKHKYAFLFVRHAGVEETLLADNEDEMNDWLAKLNYASAFRTSGVRMRGLVGGNYDGQRSRGIRRILSHKEPVKSIQTPSGEVTIVSGKIDSQMAQEILSARRDIMLQKIADADEKLADAQKNLESQLRNARHLQILAPIQPKTRDNILLAAGRISAQLKWGRITIWRLKCHRDILRMDLDAEVMDRSSIKVKSAEANLSD